MIQIETEPYSGPMDLLLDLVREAKISIYDIEIASITEQFLEAMQQIDITPDELSDFIRMASILVLMKIRSLVKDSQEEPEEDLPSREDLIERLYLYKTFKALRPFFRDQEAEGEAIYTRLPEDFSAFQGEEDFHIEGDPDKLHQSLVDLLGRKKTQEEKTFEYTKIVNLEEYSLEAMANTIRDQLLSGRHFTFKDLLQAQPLSKARLIVSFLSLLELTKSQALRLHQDEEGLTIEVVDPERLKEFNTKEADEEANQPAEAGSEEAASAGERTDGSGASAGVMAAAEAGAGADVEAEGDESLAADQPVAGQGQEGGSDNE